GESHYLTVVAKIAARRQNSGEQKRRVNRRDFTLPSPCACCTVHPVIEPAVRLRRFTGEEAERRANALACIILCNPSALGCYAERSQAEAGRRYASNVAMVFVNR